MCAYPKFTPVAVQEEDLWIGYPEETNAPYGIAKKACWCRSQAYRQQYGFNSIFLLPVNLYGPRDNFDPADSHVIPALIRKCVEATAGGPKVIASGGRAARRGSSCTSRTPREGIVLATERYDGPEPVNLGAGFEIPIKELAGSVARAHRVPGRHRLGHVVPERPAPPHARHRPRRGGLRLQVRDWISGRLARDRRVVQKARLDAAPELAG